MATVAFIVIVQRDVTQLQKLRIISIIYCNVTTYALQ